MLDAVDDALTGELADADGVLVDHGEGGGHHVGHGEVAECGDGEFGAGQDGTRAMAQRELEQNKALGGGWSASSCAKAVAARSRSIAPRATSSSWVGSWWWWRASL